MTKSSDTKIKSQTLSSSVDRNTVLILLRLICLVFFEISSNKDSPFCRHFTFQRSKSIQENRSSSAAQHLYPTGRVIGRKHAAGIQISVRSEIKQSILLVYMFYGENQPCSPDLLPEDIFGFNFLYFEEGLDFILGKTTFIF